MRGWIGQQIPYTSRVSTPLFPVPGPPRARTAQRIERGLMAYVTLAHRRAGAIVLGFVLLTALSLPSAIELLGNLHTDLVELLPPGHPAVAALHRVAPRQISSTNLVVILASPDPQANRRLAEALRPPLSALVGKVFSEVQWKPDNEVGEFLYRTRFLYAERRDLEAAEVLLARLLAVRSSPLLVDLEGDPEAELSALRVRLAPKALPAVTPVRADGAAPPAYFEHHPPGSATHYLGIMLWRRSDGLATLGDQATLDTVTTLVSQLQPQRFHPAMKVEYSGAIAMALAEQKAVVDDLSFASVVCVGLVLLSIYVFFRRLGVLFAVGVPALLGLIFALAVARYAVGSLNANSAFLISIILGNGINAPIVLLSRYGEQRGRQGQLDAMRTACATTLVGTLTAMVAASIAYGSLLWTSLRGLSQFGFIGGLGMLLVWLTTFALVPPLVALIERRFPNAMTASPPPWRRPFAWLGGAIAKRPLWVAVLCLLSLAALARPALRWARAPLDYSPSALRTDNPEVNRLWGIMYDLGMGNLGAGHIARDGVILVDTPEQADPVAEALWAQDQALGERRVLEEVRTLNKILPREQPEKLAILARLRQTLDRYRHFIDADEWQALKDFRPPDDLRLLGIPDLPRRLRENFTEVDGTMGRLIGIDADPHRFNEDDGRDLIRLDRSLRVQHLGKTWTAAATSTLFASMLDLIIHDAPRMIGAALVGVGLLLLSVFGVRYALWVGLPLAIGLFWLIGLLGTLGWRLNFLNFAALPITIGVGADYAANLAARLRQESSSSLSWSPDSLAACLARIVADTGSAVSLCSLTTILGYSSLLLSRSRALQSFGRLANLGEATCLLSALIALPCLFAWLAHRRRAARKP
jgi:hypothetical protein